MKRYWTLLFIAAGLCLFVGGFIYDMIYAGIPYQDPTPEMSVNYTYHSRIASMIRWAGFMIFLAGGVVGLIRLVIKRSQQSGRR